jgi:low molecular weight phosphotyrosine protein phosphatase
MAHAILQHHHASLPRTNRPPLILDSAGTGAYHALSPPDPRTMKTLRRHNINNFDHAARKVRPDDFSTFDYILAMDAANLDDLQDLQRRLKRNGKGGNDKAKVMLFGEFGGREREEIDDPYYGEGEGFEIAYEQCVRFSKGFMKDVLSAEV